MTFQGVQCTYAVTYVHGHVPQTTPFRRCLLFNFSCVLFQHYVISDFETTKKKADNMKPLLLKLISYCIFPSF